MRDTNIQKLVDALRSAVEVAVEQNLKPRLVEYAVQWWEPYDAHGSTGKTASRKFKDFRSVANSIKGDPRISQLLEIAGEVRNHKVPPFVVDDTAEILCDDYFNRIHSVAINETALRETATAFLDEVNSDVFEYQAAYQVAGFTAPGAFKLSDEIAFHPVTDEDIEKYGRELLPVRRYPRLNRRDWICTITQVIPMQNINSIRKVADRVLGSLGITTRGCARISLIVEGAVSPYIGGQYFAPEFWYHSSADGNAVELDLAGVERFQRIFRRVNEIIDGNEKHRIVALRRFRAASERTEIDDKIIDLVIAIESLLIPQKGAEIRYRFSIRGAAFLPERFGKMADRISLMKRLYDARSSAVHGSTSNHTQRHFIKDRAADAFRTILMRLLPAAESVENVIEKLDEAMSIGGAEWLNATASGCETND